MSKKTMKKRVAVVAASALTAGLFSVVSSPAANATTALVLTAPAASRASVATAISTLGSTISGVHIGDAQAELIKIIPGTLVQPSGGGLSENASFGGTAVTTTGTEPYVTAQVLAITPGAAGSYSMQMYADVDADGVVDSTEPKGSVSWVTGGAPTQLIATQSKVNANVGENIVISATALDASNRKTLIVSGAGTVTASAADLLSSITGLITVGVNNSATVEAITSTYGFGAINSATSASTIQLTTAADGNGKLEVLTSLPFSGVTNYAFAEGGAYDGTAGGSQNPAAAYVALDGTYKFAVNMTTATDTVTVQVGFGNTAANGTYTATATATSMTITRSTVTTPVDAESLGISATQTLTDATASTVATTATASLTTVKTASLTVDVAQPTVNFTLSKSGSTATFGIFVYRNASGADNTLTNNGALITASTVNVIPTADLTQGFQRVTLVDGSATFAVTNLTPAAGEKYSVILVKDARTPATGTPNAYALINVTYAAPLVNTTNSSISPASAVRKYGESTTMTVKVRDQFDNGIANRVISYTVSGRNPVTTAVQATTDANGNAVITLNDTAASTSTLLTDTVSVDLWPLVSPSAYVETLIITYNSVGSVVAAVTLTDNVSGDSTIEYDAVPYNGTSAVTLTATVLDANGLGLPGVPVTVALPADVKLIPAQSASGSTDASGQYTVGVYSNATGTKSFTASAGGKTSSANLQKWVQGANAGAIAQKARFLTLSSDQATTKSEGIIQFVAKATDLYGNTVANVQVRLTENGVGRFLVQTGSNSTQTLYTDSSGVITVDLTSTAGESGTNTVTASYTGNYSNAGTETALPAAGDYLSLAGYIASSPVTGAAAGVEKTTQTATFSGGTVGVSNAEVLAAIVKLIASINKQIKALQKSIKR